MKKTVAALLSLCLLLAVGLAAAETVSIEIDYEGAYIPIGGYGFSLYLPADWAIFEPVDGAPFFAGEAAGERVLWLEAVDAGGQTLEEVLVELEGADAYDNVREMFFGGVPFVTYAGDELFGAVTVTAGGESLLLLKFAPAGDEAYYDLAMQILASIQLDGEQ